MLLSEDREPPPPPPPPIYIGEGETEEEDPTWQNVFSSQDPNNRGRWPKIPVTYEECFVWSRPWGRALVLKLLGRNIFFAYAKTKITRSLETTTWFEILDLDNGFFTISVSVTGWLSESLGRETMDRAWAQPNGK